MSRLALVMIVRDEARCIERCLASARPWVDEMVVLDTGSRDDTPRRAALAGAQVHHFDWCDDFAAARNAALALTNADWRVLLDADEWVAGGAEHLAALRSHREPFIGLVSVTSLFDAGLLEQHAAPSWLPRLLPKGVQFSGRIHEQPESTLPRSRVGLVLGHDGYLDAQMAGKGERNERLLRLALAEHPHDAYWHYQLGKDLEVRGRYADAQPHYAQACLGADPQAAWRHDLVVRRLFTLKKCGAHAQALALAEAEMPHWQHSPDFFFTLGDLFLDWAAVEPARAAELLPMIEQSWLKALDIGERAELPDTVRGRGSFLAAHNLAVLNAGLGRSDEAQAWTARERELRAAVPALAPHPNPLPVIGAREFGSLSRISGRGVG